MKLKICQKCNDKLDINCFWSNGKGGTRNTCKFCLISDNRKRSNQYYHANKAEISIKRRAYYKSYYPKNKIMLSKKQTAMKLELKKKILEEYGGAKCVCCNEDETVFLSLDHINGGGNKERKELMGDSRIGGYQFYKYLKNNNYPMKEMYRILCMNCQFGTMRGRICPHQK